MIFLSRDVKRVMDETYEQGLEKPIRGVELPCTKRHRWLEPVIVELSRTGDQEIVCPRCGTKHYLTWSKVHENLRWSR